MQVVNFTMRNNCKKTTSDYEWHNIVLMHNYVKFESAC